MFTFEKVRTMSHTFTSLIDIVPNKTNEGDN